MKTMAKTLRHLGKPSRLPASPQAATLDRIANPHPDTDYVARFTAPEFTTLCPITGQPDFAYLVIDYAPGKWLLESKSFKLYLGSFRNVGAFHEDCTVAIGKKLVALLEPKFLRIGGYWIRAWRPIARGDEPRQRSPAMPSSPVQGQSHA
jgi:7-cyano-7-deazaguanine reductase